MEYSYHNICSNHISCFLGVASVGMVQIVAIAFVEDSYLETILLISFSCKGEDRVVFLSPSAFLSPFSSLYCKNVYESFEFQLYFAFKQTSDMHLQKYKHWGRWDQMFLWSRLYISKYAYQVLRVRHILVQYAREAMPLA